MLAYDHKQMNCVCTYQWILLILFLVLEVILEVAISQIVSLLTILHQLRIEWVSNHSWYDHFLYRHRPVHQ